MAFVAETRLDGLRAAALFEWPGAVHEGNGEAQIFIDESADEAQREALLKILTGQEQEPGSTVFNVFASTCWPRGCSGLERVGPLPWGGPTAPIAWGVVGSSWDCYLSAVS